MGLLHIGHLIGIVLTLVGIIALGVYSGRQVKNAADFDTGGGRAGTVLVTGSLMSTLVGGASTIGTAQLAFTYGFSALWFTLGAGLACLCFALFFVRPMRRSGYTTIQQMVTQEYGTTAGMLCSVFGIVGMLLSIVAQVLSAIELTESLLPLPTVICALISVTLMGCYVLFGGVMGAGLVGVVKTVLLYLAVLLGGFLALTRGGGLAAMQQTLDPARYFNLFARGVGVDGGAGLSLIFGILSTQTYVQCVLAGKDERASIRGALSAALLIPPIGLGGVLVGLSMRVSHPDMIAGHAFPQFVLEQLPPLLGGIVLATLLITLVGAGAGLALGAGTIVSRDIYRRIGKSVTDRRCLLVSRGSIVVLLAVSMLFLSEEFQAIILQWSFLSLALRAALTFLPMCGALFFPGRVDRRFAIAAILSGPLTVLFGQLCLTLPFDPLFLGLAVGLVLMLCGAAVPKKAA